MYCATNSYSLTPEVGREDDVGHEVGGGPARPLALIGDMSTLVTVLYLTEQLEDVTGCRVVLDSQSPRS